MRRIYLLVVGFWLSLSVNAQKGNTVPPEKMQSIYEEVKTPYKYGLVIVPKNDSQKIDCPTVFRKGKMWYMSYIMFDGKGYWM